MTHDNKSICVLNANTLETDSDFSSPTEINVSTQTPEERVQEKMGRWMPFEIIYKSE